MNNNPILNNPYEEPKLHYDTDLEGNIDYTKILQGRRDYTTTVNIAPKNHQQAMFLGSDFEDNDPDARFINGIRSEVSKWRNNGYPMTTRVTKELLNYWFCNPERQNSKRLFFCQREAVETAVYLNEVADKDPNMGRSILHELEQRLNTISPNYEDILPRTAFKMATGTGKTVVMAMFILYNYLNKKEYLQDTRFADHFLIVAPGITIRDRLGVLRIDGSHARDYDKTDYYHQRGLIPSKYESILGGLNSVLTIINYHQFEPKEYKGKKASPLDGKLTYIDGALVKSSAKESFSSVISRILNKSVRGKRILIINDEAHHCYLPLSQGKRGKQDEESKEGEEENQKAMVWYEGLRQMKKLGYKIRHVYDLSATPYYLKGSGHPEYSIFPWTVTDFGLVEAIESGLVKIPFLPAADDSHDLSEPVLRNIYEKIKDKLPKKGVKAQKKADKKEGKEKGNAPEPAPNIPNLLAVALDQFVKDYEDYNKGIRGDDEEKANLFTTPPVFIVVCNNTTVSKEVYKYIAGYQSVDADGNVIYIDGKFPLFSNSRNNIPLSKPPTLLIDSASIDEAAQAITDDFKRIFSSEIDTFKRQYAVMHGAGSADKLTEGDILREVVNTVGKPQTLGAHIRCVVSVSMLTEGWDANTVTHVCGVRAFGSQLLCEQVAGRALRRRSYALRPYDLRTGEEVNIKNLHRYNAKNVVWKFPPEYAHIIGVPFKTFKTFKGGISAQPAPPQPQTLITALAERATLEIRFPNIVGYRIEDSHSIVSVDFTGVPKFRLNLTITPTKTILQSAFSEEKVEIDNDYDDIRDEAVIYEIVRKLINAKYTDPNGGRQFEKFAQLKRIVEQWYNEQIEMVGGNGSPNQRRLVKFWTSDSIVANIYKGIHQANKKDSRITGILDYYNPTGSSAYVHGTTTKQVYPTRKSHVNYVVADTTSWEQIAAKTLEEMPEVRCYVKNHFLDFRIPYMADTEEHYYMPDFIAVCTTPKGEEVNLVIEISGFSNDKLGHKDEKRFYTENYWLPAVNGLKDYGRWAFIEVTDIDNIRASLKEKIKSL